MSHFFLMTGCRLQLFSYMSHLSFTTGHTLYLFLYMSHHSFTVGHTLHLFLYMSPICPHNFPSVFFKMLVIFRVLPVPAPGKSISGKKPVTQIIVINLVRKIPTPVNICFCVCRLNRQLSVDGFYIGVIKCIDVNCHAQTVF